MQWVGRDGLQNGLVQSGEVRAMLGHVGVKSLLMAHMNGFGTNVVGRVFQMSDCNKWLSFYAGIYSIS